MRHRLVVPAIVALLGSVPAPAAAQSFVLSMQGALDSRSSLTTGGVTTPLADGSPFSITAYFNTLTPNLVAPVGIPGFVAYRPSSVTLTLAGHTFGVTPFDPMNPAGVSVAIFDGTTPFDIPGHYAVGLLQNPLADGAGIIADFQGASPPFVLAATGVVPVTFVNYFGVGVQSGVCIAGPPDDCDVNAATPIPLTLGAQPYFLTLDTYDQDAPDGATFTASIAAAPEPATLALFAPGLLGLAAVGRRRAHRR